MIETTESLTRRRLLQTSLAAGAFYITAPASGKELRRGNSKKPNLVFIFSDQQSSDMLGCYGNEQIVTPNLDRFASQGVRFNHCISQTPVCTPYRGMLMTGQHPLYNGCISNDVQLAPDTGGKHFGQVLTDAGYKAAYIGKWHLHGGDRRRPIPAGPHRHGFNDAFLSNNCHVDFRPGKCFYWNKEGQQVFFDKWEVYGQTDQALEYLDTCNINEPFAMFVSWHPPHDWGKTPDGYYKYDTLDELMQLYNPDKIKVRPNVENSPQRRRQYHGHMAMCSGVDIAFGRIMDKLSEKGLDKDTIVVFTSDHGDLLGSHGRPWPKSSCEDESARVPFIIRHPKVLPAGGVSDLLVGTLNLMPTILGMMGLEIPKSCQEKNLTPHIIAGRDDAIESLPFMYFIPGYRGVYTKRYTYTIDYNNFNGKKSKPAPGLDFSCLYDKKNDRYQQNNLFHSTAHKTLRQQMNKLTCRWMDKYEDTFVDHPTLLRLCLGTTDGHLARKGKTGILKGRPIDILKKADL